MNEDTEIPEKMVKISISLPESIFSLLEARKKAGRRSRSGEIAHLIEQARERQASGMEHAKAA